MPAATSSHREDRRSLPLASVGTVAGKENAWRLGDKFTGAVPGLRVCTAACLSGQTVPGREGTQAPALLSWHHPGFSRAPIAQSSQVP